MLVKTNEPKYRLLAVDADGTLLNDERKITVENKEAIRRANEAGVVFSICSGRSCKSLKTMMDELALPGINYIISFNGGEIHEYPSMKLMYETKLARNDALSVIHLARECGLGIIPTGYINNNLWFAEEMTPERKLYLEISTVESLVVERAEDAVQGDIAKLLFLDEPEKLAKLTAYFENRLPYGVNMFYSGKYMLEVTPAEAEKGRGLTKLAEAIGIPVVKTIGIGDNFNDMSLIKTAGLGIAVANAEAELKLAARYVTHNTNDASAVAEAITKFIL